MDFLVRWRVFINTIFESQRKESVRRQILAGSSWTRLSVGHDHRETRRTVFAPPLSRQYRLRVLKALLRLIFDPSPRYIWMRNASKMAEIEIVAVDERGLCMDISDVWDNTREYFTLASAFDGLSWTHTSGSNELLCLTRGQRGSQGILRYWKFWTIVVVGLSSNDWFARIIRLELASKVRR